MTKPAKKAIAGRFMDLLVESSRLSRKLVDSEEHDPGLVTLSAWQVARLERTYADFSRKRRFKKAVTFFLSDLYGPVDFSQRDEDIRRIYPVMVKVLSSDAIESLGQGLELNNLTMQLDEHLLDVMRKQFNFDPALDPDGLTTELYADAYRLCDNYDQRRHQVQLILDAGRSLEQVTRKKMILTAVKVARKPAKIAGFGELQSFIERGLAAFRAMGDSSEFLGAIESRELAILEDLFADREPDPRWFS